MSTSQLNLRVSPDEKDEWTERARWDRQTLSHWIRETCNAVARGELVPASECGEDGPQSPLPFLERVFADDHRFNILEWIVDEPGTGETTITVGAKVRATTLQIIERILMDPRCPYTTKSDYIRDAVLTLAYVIAKGRFYDEEAAEWAARQRAYAKAQQLQGLRVSQEAFLNQERAFIEAPGADRAERSFDAFTRVAKLIEKEDFEGLRNEADALARTMLANVDEAGKVKLKERFPEVVERLS